MFAIGIRDEHTGLQQGLCDIYFGSPISVAQLQTIADICEEQVIQAIRQQATMCIIDILRAIADVIVKEKGTVEVDLNLQHHGTWTFASGVTDAALVFCRLDRPWPENLYEIGGEGKTATEAHAFLFSSTF